MELIHEDYRECEVQGYERANPPPGEAEAARHTNPLVDEASPEPNKFEASSLAVNEPWIVSRGYACLLAVIMCITCINPFSVDLGKGFIYRFAQIADQGDGPSSDNMHLCDKVSAIGHQNVTFGMLACLAAGIPQTFLNQSFLRALHHDEATTRLLLLGTLDLIGRVAIMLATFLWGAWAAGALYGANWQGG